MIAEVEAAVEGGEHQEEVLEVVERREGGGAVQRAALRPLSNPIVIRASSSAVERKTISSPKT